MSESSSSGALTTGIHLSGKRHQVSTNATKAGRHGKCRDCGTVVALGSAKEVCLDWDGVDAYHFYCPRCYRGTQDPHYYTGQLLGSNGSAVIDQHSWEREG